MNSMMGRLLFQFTVILCFFSMHGMGLEGYRLMDWKTEFTVRTHLLQQMHVQYDLRRDALHQAQQSKESMLAYRDSCRQKYLDLLGEFPEKSPLNPQITKTIKREGYRIENVLFESLPKHHVAANFYLPDGEGPFPAALIFCGHEMTSKATESYQKTAILFAKNGFAALVVDPISQGEMVQFTDENGLRILRGSTTGHTLLNAGSNLVGTSVAAYELYDRVKVAAPCSYIASRERNFDLQGADDGCQHVPFEGRELLEIGDFLIMFAPKPLLILAGRYDFVDYTGTVQTFEELNRVYEVLNEPEKVDLFTVDDGHGISLPKREAAVRWFRRWLCHDTTVVPEPDLAVLGESDLNCTPKGQVNELFVDERNIQQINLDKGNELGQSRKKFADNHDMDGYRGQIMELLDMDDQQKHITEALVGTEEHQGFQLRKYILRTGGEIPVPCLVYTPLLQRAEPRAAIYIMEEGKSSLSVNDSVIESHMQQGDLLIFADLRGMGETREREEDNAWKLYNREYHNAMLSIHLGRSLVGQRVTDLLTLIDFIGKGFTDGLSIDLHASGAAGPVAIYAALFRPRIKSIHISHSIQTYFDILNFPFEVDWYSYVIPDVLSYFNIPDLITIRGDLVVSYRGEKSRIKDHSKNTNRLID